MLCPHRLTLVFNVLDVSPCENDCDFKMSPSTFPFTALGMIDPVQGLGGTRETLLNRLLTTEKRAGANSRHSAATYATYVIGGKRQ